MTRRGGNDVVVELCPDGPLLVRGADTVRAVAALLHMYGLIRPGNESLSRPVVAVCTCGKSQRRPWCDGTHMFLRRPVT